MAVVLLFYSNSHLHFRVTLSATDITGSDFVEMLLNGASSGNSSDICRQAQLQGEIQEERMQKLQATVEAQSKLLEAMAERLNIKDYQ